MADALPATAPSHAYLRTAPSHTHTTRLDDLHLIVDALFPTK
eukprot:gene26634-4538_t